MLISMLSKMIPNDSEHVTIELRKVVEDTDIFDRCNPFPIWDENHRGELEKKIIEHYYFRQIGFETVGRFVFKLNTRLREIMPNMIKLYATTKYNYNPIENYNMEEQGTDNVKNDSENLAKYSETPQGEVNNLIEGKYLTNATHGTGNNKTETKHTFSRHGNIGVTSSQQLIEQERKIVLDIDLLIIDNLKDLFLGVY